MAMVMSPTMLIMAVVMAGGCGDVGSDGDGDDGASRGGGDGGWWILVITHRVLSDLFVLYIYI